MSDINLAVAKAAGFKHFIATGDDDRSPGVWIELEPRHTKLFNPESSWPDAILAFRRVHDRLSARQKYVLCQEVEEQCGSDWPHPLFRLFEAGPITLCNAILAVPT